MQCAEDKVNCDEYFARDEEKFNAFHRQHMSRLQGSPVVPIQSRFDTKSFRYKVVSIQSRFDIKSFRYKSSRLVTYVKLIRYKDMLLQVVLIQNTILYLNDQTNLQRHTH